MSQSYWDPGVVGTPTHQIKDVWTDGLSTSGALSTDTLSVFSETLGEYVDISNNHLILEESVATQDAHDQRIENAKDELQTIETNTAALEGVITEASITQRDINSTISFLEGVKYSGVVNVVGAWDPSTKQTLYSALLRNGVVYLGVYPVVGNSIALPDATMTFMIPIELAPISTQWVPGIVIMAADRYDGAGSLRFDPDGRVTVNSGNASPGFGSGIGADGFSRFAIQYSVV